MAAAIQSGRLVLVLMALILAGGCASDPTLRVVGPYPDSARLNQCLLYWTAHFSSHPVNHYYVARTNHPAGLVGAFIYWKEERELIEYQEVDLEPGEQTAEILAFHHALKLDRDTVDTADDIAGSSYLVTHKAWLEWMENCLARGREYVISADAARKAFPAQVQDDRDS